MTSNYKRIGQYVQQVKARNKDLSLSEPKGITINKMFMPSVANTTGTDLSKYRVVSHEQFAYNPMHVGRDEGLPISMLRQEKPIIVSPAYVVFEIIDKEQLLPEYLMMWCSRPEFDRNTWFTTDSSVRGGFNWNDFCDMELPVPHIDKQREIVREYNVIVDRIKLNEALCTKLEDTAQALYKHWFVDFEFPISADYAKSIGKPELEGKPYKSNNGEMKYCDELEKDIPEGWCKGQLIDILELQRGFDLPLQLRVTGSTPIYSANGATDFHNISKVNGPGVVTGRSGTLGAVFYVEENFWPLNTTLWVKNFNKPSAIFAYFTLKNIDLKEFNGGSAVPTLNRNHAHTHNLCIPNDKTVQIFEERAVVIFKNRKSLIQSLKSLRILKDVILSKMAQGMAVAA